MRQGGVIIDDDKADEHDRGAYRENSELESASHVQRL